MYNKGITTKEQHTVDILSHIDSQRKQLNSTTISGALRELVSMYRNQELILRPEYQRALVWSPRDKTLLIESILLNIPIPSIYVAADSGGRWEVLDGLQRTSTILAFVEGLADSDSAGVPPFTTLTDDLTYLSDLKGFTFKDLPLRVQRDFLQYRLNYIVIDNFTAESKKLEVFNRLNNLGVPHC